MKFILYVRVDCDYCVKAVEVLRAKNIEFDVLVQEREFNIWPELKKIYNWHTVPMIFEVTGEREYKLIGGYTDLLERLDIEDA